MLSPALLLLFGWLFTFPSVISSFYFEIDGHYSAISAADILAAPTQRAHFLPAELKLRQRLTDLFKGQLDEFYVHSFSLHGEEEKSAVFTAYLSTSLPRAEVVHLVSQEESLDFFRVRHLAALPTSPENSPMANETVTSCQNGGFLLPNNSCSCPAFVNGDSCQVVNCLNGGIADRGRCACPPGVYALNCEQRGCLPPVEANLDFSQTTFILVVNQRSTMAFVLDRLANLLGVLLEDIFADARFDSYIIVNYVHTKNALQITKNVFKHFDEVSNYLNSLVYSIQGLEKQPTQRAVLEAQSFYPLMKPFSDVFVFMDSLDEDARPTNYSLSSNFIENQLILQSIAWRNRVNYYFSESATDFSNSGDGYDTYHRVAKATLGDVYTYPMAEAAKVINTIDTYSGCQTIAAIYDFTNTLNLDVSIPGGEEPQEIFVFVTSATGNLPKVTDAERKQMNVLLNGTRWEIYQTTSANKKVIVHPGGRRVNVRACIGASQTLLLTAGYNPNIDVGTVYLSADYSNYLTGLSVGSNDTIAEVQWISLLTQQREAVTAGTARSSECTHPVAFEVLGPCTPGPVGQLVTITSNAKVVSRLIPGFCVLMDKPNVPGFQCFNGGTRQGVKTCHCVPEWEGPQCNVPVCHNGGKVNNFPGNGFGPCSCAAGFSGDHCTILDCTVSPTNVLSPSSTTLAVVIQSSLSQAAVGANVDNGVAKLLQAMAGTDQYDQFVLTTFAFERTNGSIQNVIGTSAFRDPAMFQTAVNTVRYLPTPNNVQDPLAALTATFSNNSFYNSALFLFVDAQPKETSAGPDVLMTAVERSVPINVVVSPPFDLMEQCMPRAEQLFYEQLATKSGGIFLNLCQETVLRYNDDPVYSLFVAFAVAHHRTEVINEIYTPDFEIKPSLFFQVDQPMNDVFLVVNCPKTESVSTTIENHELGFGPPVGSVVNMPFLAVYKVPTTAQNKNGYTATVRQGSSFASADGPCSIQAVIKSNHQAYLRFSPNPSIDALQETIDFAIPTYPVVHVDNPQLNRSYVPTLTATDDKGTFSYEGIALTRTNSCVFEYWLQKEFTCQKPSDSFVLRFSGMTTDGNTYLRSLRGFCYLETGVCANGGYKLSNGLCKCPPTFGGLYCQSPKCQNGFPLNSQDFECMCGVKYTGQFCEIPVCNNWNYMESVDPRSSRPRQITFILNKNVDSLLVNVQLTGIIQAIVDQTEAQDVPVMYSLLLYDQYGVERVVSTSHADQFIQYFQYEAVNNVQKQLTFTTKSVDALVEAYKLNIQAPGIIYLFMGSPAMAPSQNAVDNYLEQKINTQVNIFYTPQKSGTYPDLPTDQETSILIQAVKQSGGRYLPLSQNSVSQMTQMLVSSTRAKDLVFEYGLQTCNVMCSFSFDLESQFREVELTITGIDVAVPGYVSVKDGQKRSLSLDGYNVLFRDNQVLVLRFNSSQAVGGQWAVEVKTGYGPSSIQVHVDSNLRVFPGFTVDQFDDFVHQLPFTGLGLNRSTYMTFRLTDPSATLNKVVVYRAYFNDPASEGVNVDTLYLTRRDSSSCAYQYVSSEWAVDYNSQQKFVLLGADSKEVVFQRTLFYQFPLFNQRAATCIHGTHDQYGQCICTDSTKWTGDYCSVPMCHNGGTASYGICICRNGFYGDFCELAVTH